MKILNKYKRYRAQKRNLEIKIEVEAIKKEQREAYEELLSKFLEFCENLEQSKIVTEKIEVNPHVFSFDYNSNKKYTKEDILLILGNNTMLVNELIKQGDIKITLWKYERE